MKLLLALTTLALTCHVHAQLIGVEDFTYANGGVAGLTGGTGFDFNNLTDLTTGTTSDWDNVGGAPNIVSNTLVTDGSSAKREFNGTVEGAAGGDGDDTERAGALRGNGILFFTVDITRTATATWSGASVYDFGDESTFFGVPGSQAATDTIGIVGGGFPDAIGAISLVDGQTYTLLCIHDFDNDQQALFVDPDGADYYDPSDGSTSADVTRAYTSGAWTTAIRLASGGETSWDDLTAGHDNTTVGLATSMTVNDVDGDGLPAAWEAANGLDDNDDGSTNVDNGPLGDPDGDGLNNLGEFNNGTDPQVADSDGDGFNDGTEVTAGTDPNNAASYPGAPDEPNIIGIESFDYPNGAIADKDGGTFWDFDNSTENDAFFGHTTTQSDWDATGGNPQIASGVLVTNNSSAKREYNGPIEGVAGGSDERFGSFGDNAQFDKTVVYYKFEMTQRAGATWSGASTFDFGTERYLFGVPGTANPGSGNLEFAIHDLNTDQHAYSGIQPVLDQSYTLVAKLDFANDIAALYLDPNLSQSEASNTPVATYAHTSSNWSSAVRLGSGGAGNVEWDDLRVTTTWDTLEDGPPTANDDAITMHHLGKARLLPLTNDTGSINPASITITAGPSSGTATPSLDGSILYEHTTGLPTTDSFTYQIENSSGTLNDTGIVTVNFTTNSRFDSEFVSMPAIPPVTALGIEDAFPGITFDSPHGFCSVPGDTQKLFVTEGDGKVFIIPDIGAVTPTKTEILDITSQTNHDDNEFAFKSVAAHPDWATNGFIYVTYNTNTATSRLSRFTCLTSAPYTASSEQILIDQADAGVFHNISNCKFGADGYLFVGFGDEGTQSDGYDNSQHIDKDLWSCIIRIDVDKKPGNLEPNADPDIPRDGGGDAYFSVPADNPFVGATTFNGVSVSPTQVRTEIFITGQRNPWQFSPEDTNGDNIVDEVWIGDVGRSNREEVGVYTPGQNGGWAWREGTQAGIRSGDIINGAAEAAATLTEPLWDYGHGGGTLQGNSVTGGFIYRANALPTLTDKYVFADYVSGNIWCLEQTLPAPTITRLAGEVAIVALLTDPSNGDILLLDRGNVGGSQGTGGIKRLTVGSNDSGYPQTLSETNFFADLSDLSPNPGAEAFNPNLRFWSDFAEKSRWFLLNDSADTFAYSKDDPWTFPEGMVWVKHFDYPTDWETFSRTINGQSVTDRRPTVGSPRRRLETRFIVSTASSSYGVSYRWNNINGGSQTDATLANNNGASFDIDINIDGSPTTTPWLIPSRSSCLSCHTPQAGPPLSFNTRQLNAPGTIAGVPGNFLSLLSSTGYLTGSTADPATLPRFLRPDETSYSLEARVRSYLDVNCAYCHKSGGTGGGNWDGRGHLNLSQTGLVNTASVDAPLNPGDLLVIPGNVDGSIIYNRTAADNGYSRMPPLATNEVDLEGAQLLADWIASELQPYTTYQEWRIAKFGNDTSPQGEPSANPDGDLFDNNYEWLTNTNPNDSNSFWQPLLSNDGINVAYDFAGLGNRSVRIFRSDDLQNWSPWAVPGNDGLPLNPASVHSFTGPILSASEFFRIEIKEQ